jgi:predicted transcriptional regulator
MRKKRRALSMLARGCSDSQVAGALELSQVTVHKYRGEMKAIFKELPTVEAFRATRTDLMDAAMSAMLKSSVTPDKLEKATVNGLAYAMRQLYDMGRLERGQSTANIATFVSITAPK